MPKRDVKAWAFSRDDRVIGGRPRGAEFRDRILSVLRDAPPDSALPLDFSAVVTLDFSAADELVNGLVGRVISGELGSKRFYLLGLNDAVRESIAAVLDLKRRNCLEFGADRKILVLGPLSAPHRETFAFVCEREAVTAADVAKKFWGMPKMTAATNRLNTLADAGLVLRVPEQSGRRGNRFVYRSIIRVRPRRVDAA